MKKLSNYLDNKKVILAILLIVSILTLLICSKNSPLYPYNDWVDGNAFFTMGKGIAIAGQIIDKYMIFVTYLSRKK